MDVLHLNSEVSMVGSDSFTDHQGRLPSSILIQAETFTQWSYKLLLGFRNLYMKKEMMLFNKNSVNQCIVE